MNPEIVDGVVKEVKSACGAPVGITTGAWIEPDVERRCKLIRRWRVPDYATVNLSEDGSTDVMRALLSTGIGIEAGVWTAQDVNRLDASGLGDRLLRVCVEPVDLPPVGAVQFVNRIHVKLDRLGLPAPRLQHGDGAATWILLENAVNRGIDTRIGLEDTFRGPDGRVTSGNEELVRVASKMLAGPSRSSQR